MNESGVEIESRPVESDDLAKVGEENAGEENAGEKAPADEAGTPRGQDPELARLMGAAKLAREPATDDGGRAFECVSLGSFDPSPTASLFWL